MTFDEYQAAAEATNLTPGDLGKVMSVSFMDKVLGLVGESGEFADKVKKILRDDNAQMSEEKRQLLSKVLRQNCYVPKHITKLLDEQLAFFFPHLRIVIT